MSITAVIDHEEYIWGNGGVFLIGGWCVPAKGEQIEIRMLADGKVSLPCGISSCARPDVRRARPDLKIKDDQIGFSVKLEALEQMFKNFRTLEVVAVQGTEKKLLLTRKIEEMKAGYRNSALIYFIDEQLKADGQILLKGWIVSAFPKERIWLRDAEGKKLPCCLKRIPRKDVARARGISEDVPYGFVASLPRKTVQGKSLVLHMENQMTMKEYVINMKQLDFESSKRGKLKKVLGREYLDRNRKMIKEKGIPCFVDFVRDEILTESERYMYWLKRHTPGPRELRRQRESTFGWQPLMSIVVPLYNTPPVFLKALLDSIARQSYENWEVCLADGSPKEGLETFVREHYGSEQRIRYKKLEKNMGIAGNTNGAIAMAKGEFLVFADHDDLLTADALYELVRALNEDPGTDMVYSDEDLTDSEGTRFHSPRFKPDFNLDLLRSINYICHLLTVRKSLAEEAGLLRGEYDGAQDHEFLLRLSERTDRIRHIPKILYHWRAHEDSTAGNQGSKDYAVSAAMRGLTDHYRRLGYDAKVAYTGVFIVLDTILRVKDSPLVSVIIPNKDAVDSLDVCVRSIFEKTDYKNFEILIVENNSEKPETFAYYERIQKQRENVRVIRWKEGFNYSAINNFAVRQAKGEYLLFLNNDVEVITPYWMSRMLGQCQRKDVGAAGAKLFYPDNTVQHAGVVVGIGWFAGHVMNGRPKVDNGYLGRLIAIQDISAVTGACMMVKRSVFEKVGGFDEELAVALNDVDLCLKIRREKQLIVMDPGAQLYHYESKSRGQENTEAKVERFKTEIRRFRGKWKEILEEGDPYYNPNLTLCNGECTLRKNNEVPEIYRKLFGGKEDAATAVGGKKRPV